VYLDFVERTRMLMAYEDLGFQIKDIPLEDPRVPLFPIEKRSDAVTILKKAKSQRPEILWVLEGDGPYRVREKKI
jgi:hypothetical protein